jgi:hypothetical protein
LQEFDPQKYREFVRTLSDEALIQEWKKMRWLSGDGKIVSTMPSAFDEQLKICRGSTGGGIRAIIADMLSPPVGRPIPYRNSCKRVPVLLEETSVFLADRSFSACSLSLSAQTP